MKDKNIVIAGASSGLGRALAELLLANGANLFLLSRSIESSNKLDSAIKIPCDFRDPKSIQDAFSKINSVDIFINCVGVGLVKTLENTTSDEVVNLLHTNLVGAIISSQEAYKKMIIQKSGHIINISSTSGIKSRPLETIYCASKWGMRGFTESLRLAAVEHKVRVTGVYPGGMKTDFWKINPDQNVDAFMDPEDVAEQIVHLLDSPISISPSELVIERGF
ncbi:MAG: SDR family oxidoreductase [Candidatus Levybacteria bacterium]|nr:SDR family oxidoreductase [Candidatus Levybacteria bacterium]